MTRKILPKDLSVMMKPGTVKVGMQLMAPPGLVEVLHVRKDGWCWCRYIWSYHHAGSSALGKGCEGWWKDNQLRKKRRTDIKPERVVLYGVSRITSGGQRGEYPSALRR